MNRFLCKEIQKRNRAKNIAFNWELCGTCTYVSRCQDYEEDKNRNIKDQHPAHPDNI